MARRWLRPAERRAAKHYRQSTGMDLPPAERAALIQSHLDLYDEQRAANDRARQVRLLQAVKAGEPVTLFGVRYVPEADR